MKDQTTTIRTVLGGFIGVYGDLKVLAQWHGCIMMTHQTQQFDTLIHLRQTNCFF